MGAKIAVTGGSGKLGSRVIRELLRQGFGVVSLDERRSDAVPCRQIKVDLTDLGQTAGGLAGADAVLHLAAIPGPLGHTPEQVYANNAIATYNVFEAASMLGIGKVVFGSSESIYGFAWAPEPFDPTCFPLDEDHPVQPKESYGLSKEAGERTAAMFARRTGMQAIALRYSLIATPEEYERLPIRNPGHYAKILWSYIDVRDAVEASIAALLSDAEGFHALNVTSDDTLSDRPTASLLAEFYPEVRDLRRKFAGREAIVSNERAKRTLGWKPGHSWQG